MTRALYLAASICPGEEKALTLRAAEMGYAPAQTDLSFAAELRSDDVQMFRWAKKACKHQGDRRAMYQLGCCYARALGCAKNKARAMELYQEAAE
jgi:TPR repeat protein